MLAEEVRVSAIIPAFARLNPLLKTLRMIDACKPRPQEILVHVDSGTPVICDAVRKEFPHVRLLTSDRRLGPGASRNILVAEARCDWVANFDDDSFPQELDYFARIGELTNQFPEAAILSAANHDDARRELRYTLEPLASGCGCVFRRDWYLRCGGFVPVPVGYNMEEVDMGLRLYALGGRIIRDDWLRVVHDKPPPEYLPAALNSAILANTALLPFLRFPVWCWPIGVWQVFRRIVFLVRRGWTEGLTSGILYIPFHFWRFAKWRQVVPPGVIFRWLRLKRQPLPVSPKTIAVAV